MAAVPVMMSGVLYPKNKKDPPIPATFVGNAWNPNLSVGGGPIVPPGSPPGIWGGPIDPYPDIGLPIPPTLPPDATPPAPPEPGAPTTAVPGEWPVQPVVPPPFIVVNYPGVGPVIVAPPATAAKR